MVEVIDPRVNVVSYGPELRLPNGQVITADEFVYGAASVTYKGMGVIEELFKLRGEGTDISKKIESSLIKSAGAGHASMATTPGLWFFMEGPSSKLVDSIFTGARFSSSLMPSSRRVPIEKGNILVPRGIAEMGGEAVDTYMQVSEDNISAYETLQKRGVPKEEAAKIVQYGHWGGGFAFMPLETLIHFSKQAERNPDSIPLEGIQVISQLEKFVKSHGMNVVYEARKAAPREGGVNPNVFTDKKNQAQELVDSNYKGVLFSPAVLNEFYLPSEEFEKRVNSYLAMREKVFSNPEGVRKDWRAALSSLDEVVGDFNNSVGFMTVANSPWRVWGEVKRHRTLPQNVESVYHAVERAQRIPSAPEALNEVFSMPPTVTRDRDNYNLWVERFLESLKAYQQLTDRGVKKSDAIALIPRGIKVGIVKNFDLFNLTTGYMSLRLCNTAEREMKEITERERDLIRESKVIPSYIERLVVPKCNYVGFCPDTTFCGNIGKVAKGYGNAEHETMKADIGDNIRRQISRPTD